MSQPTVASPVTDRPEHEVRTIVQALVLELAPDAGPDVDVDWKLIEDLGYHSLALLELAFAVEDEFDIEPIDQETAQGILTCRDVADYVVGVLHAGVTRPA